MNTITTTHFQFPGQKSVYRGKVREVYNINDELLVMIATDRLSAFDVVMPRGIPYKGQILNQIATKFMHLTQDIVPNWLIASPDPNVAVGHLCEPFKVEMVIRGYLSGHAAREYALGKRTICGVTMAEGLKENDKFPMPIITPTTKADNGSHDEDISREAILAKGIVSEEDYLILEKYTRALYQRGTEIAASRGLILVDTKYEFGKTKEGKALYKRRKETIERSFADAKQLHGHRYARMRGLAKVLEQCLLAAACQNMKKIALLIARFYAFCLLSRFQRSGRSMIAGSIGTRTHAISDSSFAIA